LIQYRDNERVGTVSTPCPVCISWLNQRSCLVLNSGLHGPASVMCRGVAKGAPLPPGWRKSAKEHGWKGTLCMETSNDTDEQWRSRRSSSLVKAISKLAESKKPIPAAALEAQRQDVKATDADADHQALLKMQVDRDRKARALAMANPLRAGDRFWRELEERGVNPQALVQCGLGTLVPGLYPNAEGLAGLDDSAYLGAEVGLIPSTVTTSKGETLITGYQVWVPPESRIGDGSKYKYLSKGRDAEGAQYLKVVLDENDPNSTDEGLLFQHDPDPSQIAEPRHLLLTDSSLKAFVAAQRHQLPAAGQPGMGYAKAGSQLRALLTQIAKIGGTAVLCADAGDLENPSMLNALLSSAKMIQSWGFNVRWAVWTNQVSKNDGVDIDELKSRGFELATTEEFLGHAGIRMQELANNAVHNSRQARGFQIREDDEVLCPPFDLSEPERYDKGQLSTVLKAKLASGYRMILNSAYTGAGKSWFTSKMRPQDFGVEYIRWITTRHYTSATETDVPFVRGKNKGLVKTAEGDIRVLQPDEQPGEGETQIQKLNCIRMSELRRFQQLQAGNHISSLCTDCIAFENCSSTQGMYRYERDLALSAPVCAIHPGAVMDMHIPGDNQGGTGLVIDELMLDTFTETIRITVDDTRRLTQLLEASGRYQRLKTLVVDLTGVLTEKGRHSNKLVHKAVESARRTLGQMKASEWAAAIALEEDWALESKLRRCLISWLQDLVAGRAVIRSDNGALAFLRLNHRLLSACHAAKWILIQDATAVPAEVCALFRIDPHKVVHIAEHLPFDTAEVRALQIVDSELGPLGSNRSPDQQFRLGEIIRLLIEAGYFPDDIADASVVGNKTYEAFVEEFFGKHHVFHRDHRGSNKSKTCTLLALAATPIINIGHLASRYELLFGTAPENLDRATATVSHLVQQVNGQDDLVCRVTSGPDGQFTSYVHHDISSSQIQARGRLREYRRGGEQLTVVNLAEYPVPWPVELLSVRDLKGWADIERINDLGMKKVAQNLQRQGSPVNAQSLAAATGVDVEILHRFLRTRTLRPDRFWDSILRHAPDPDDTTSGRRQLDEVESELLTALAA
jgi:hypothetical protein